MNPLGFGLLNPTTAEVSYVDDEMEFIRAIEDYRKKYRRRFLTWREVFHVLCSLGYCKVAKGQGDGEATLTGS